jgi:transcription initiation factor TFIID subunit 7
MVKIKLGTKAMDESPVEPPQPPSRKPSMKISFKPQAPSSEQAPSLPSPAVAEKPKSAPKKKAKAADNGGSGDELHGQGIQRRPTVLKLGKRARDVVDGTAEGELPAKRPVKPTERAGSISFRVPPKPDKPVKPLTKTPTLKLNTKLQTQPSGVKLKFASGSAVAQSATTPVIKIRARGKIPKRDPGVGYDSEDEDAEVDPVIENHFILRMQPGADADYLRQAIAESGMKHKPDGSKALGPDVWFKFWDKEGRHGVVCVRGHMYAATLLDLPCIVEAMKSWDKKGWYKTSDIAQILLVLGRIEKEEDSKEFPLPPEVDEKNWQYPHGLTPPMQWVRKRRFRKRVNRRHIERVEADVEELLKKDRDFEEGAVDADINLSWVDPEAPEDSEMDAEGDEEMDGEGDYDIQYQDEDGNIYDEDPNAMDQDQLQYQDQDAEGEDDGDDLEAQMLAAMEAGEDETEPQTTFLLNPSALQASPDTLHPPDTPAQQSQTTENEATSDEDESDEDEVAEDEEDEEAKAQREEREQMMGEIRDLEEEIANQERIMAKQSNALLKGKIRGQIEKLRADLVVKRSGLGLGEEDE